MSNENDSKTWIDEFDRQATSGFLIMVDAVSKAVEAVGDAVTNLFVVIFGFPFYMIYKFFGGDEYDKQRD